MYPPDVVDIIPIVQLITLPHHLVVPPLASPGYPAEHRGHGFRAASSVVFVRFFV
jgi:hypothetical protein